MDSAWRSFIIINQDTGPNPCFATLSTEEASWLKGGSVPVEPVALYIGVYSSLDRRWLSVSQ